MKWSKVKNNITVKIRSLIDDLRSKQWSSTGTSPDKCIEPSSKPPAPSSPPPSASFSSPINKMESKRPMKYPYTLTAKIVQFPLRYYTSNVWMWKYYFFGVALTIPIFYKIGKLSQSPENVAKWNEIRRKEFTPGGHH